jgi:protein FAM32A
MSDEYAKVSRGKLKLKTDGEISKKKKKKKDKDREREAVANIDRETIQVNEPTSSERKLTKAEMSFKKMQDKMVTQNFSSALQPELTHIFF